MFLRDTYKENVNQKIRSAKDFKIFPDVNDRQAWEKVNPVLKASKIKAAEAVIDRKWNDKTAMDFINYFKKGQLYNAHEERNAFIMFIIAECLENKGRFIEQIVNGIWYFCEKTDWASPNHLNHMYDDASKNVLPDIEEQYRFIDLHAAMTAEALAWAYYFHKEKLDEITPLICKRIKYEVRRKIFDTYLVRKDFGWMGFVPSRRHKVNNWNPYIVSHILGAAFILEDDDERRADIVDTSLMFLDNYLNVVPEDGGCDEGPGYWSMAGGSVFDCLELLYYVTDGKFNVFDNEKIKNMGLYMDKVHIYKDYFVNFADNLSKEAVPIMLCRYGKAVNDESLYKLGYSSAGQHGSACKYRVFADLFTDISGDCSDAEFVADSWMPDTQIGTARENTDSYKGLYLAFKGGHNDESHNHNDVGNFIVYSDGTPVLIDIGSGTYVPKTFSDRRYELYNNCSDYHNLPTVNGYTQKAGRDFAASDVKYHSEEKRISASMSIKNAYPKDAKIMKWNRNYELDRTVGKIIITDDYELEDASDNVEFTLMTNICPEITGNSINISLPEANDVYIDFPEHLVPEIEKLPLNEVSDGKIKQSWGELYRILLKQTKFVKSDVVSIICHR